MPAVEREAGPLVFLVAGETSADMIGGRLMAELRRRTEGRVRFAGVGGPRMVEQGLESLYPMEDLTVVGITEIVPHLPRIVRRLNRTASEVRRLEPDAVLCIDTSAFSRALARRLRSVRSPIIQYKAPQAWAYWPGRARTMARCFDHVLMIFPFEPEFFARYGVEGSFIGHPAAESGADAGDGAGFRARNSIAPDGKLLAMLPGSRPGEVGWSLDIFAETAAILAQRVPDLTVVVPTVESVAARVEAAVGHWPARTIVVRGQGERYDAFAAADAALTVTGTVTAELMLARVPFVGCYRGSALTAWMARRITTVDYFTVVNLLLDRPAVPELLQEECRPERLAEACFDLLSDREAREGQQRAFDETVPMLRADTQRPTERTAEVVLELIEARRNDPAPDAFRGGLAADTQ